MMEFCTLLPHCAPPTLPAGRASCTHSKMAADNKSRAEASEINLPCGHLDLGLPSLQNYEK